MTFLFCSLIFIMSWILPLFGFSCSEGPPGRYCTEDLRAYHLCEVVKGSLRDTVVSCPKKTRCTCFFGPSCSSSLADPCGPFVVPPIFNYSFTLRYHGTITNLAPTGTFKKNIQGLWYQLIDGPNSKRALSDWGTSKTQTVTVPTSKGGWKEYVSYSSRSTCARKSLDEFPAYRVPWDFNKDGNEVVLGTNTQRWKRITGGRNSGSSITVDYYYTKFDKARGVIRPVRYTSIQSGLRNTKIISWTVGLFYARVVPYSIVYFKKPAFC